MSRFVQGHADLAALLIAAGADLEAEAEGRGNATPLLLCARRGHRHLAEQLLAAGADPNVNDDDDTTALEAAAEGAFTGRALGAAASGDARLRVRPRLLQACTSSSGGRWCRAERTGRRWRARTQSSSRRSACRRGSSARRKRSSISR
jgi:hypothetical protein